MTEAFEATSVISDLRKEEKTIISKYVAVDMEDYKNPYPALEFLVTFSLGLKYRNPDESTWNKKLDDYVLTLCNNGWTMQKINNMICKIMNRVRFGVEAYR